MYLIYCLNINMLALNIDILPDILNNDILSSCLKRGKYKFSYFPCLQTEATKQMVAGKGWVVWWVVSGRRAGGS